MGTKQVICRVECFWTINFCVNQFLGQFLDFQHALEDQSSFDLVHLTFYLANPTQALHEKKIKQMVGDNVPPDSATPI